MDSRIEVYAEFTPPWREPEFWAGTRAPLTNATALKPEAYTSQDFFADERRQVFERSWVCIGLAADAQAGTVLVRAVGSRSILVIRDGDGDLYGHLNSCRHRGTELYECDAEVTTTLRCPYHRWGYRFDGSLVSTPRFAEIPRDDFDQENLGLVPVRVDSWGPLLFACLDEHTVPLTEWLGDLPERMSGYGLDSWVPRESQDIAIEANWKLISENFQEYYHLAWVHPELAKVSRVEDHYRYQGPGMYCGQTTTPVSNDERDDWLALSPAAGLDDSDLVSGRFVAIYPNVLLSVLPNHCLVMQLDPVGPGATQERCSWLLPPSTIEADADTFEGTKSFWLDINREDIEIVQRGQRGLERGAVAPGPLSPRFEEPLHRFHNMLADTMMSPSMRSIAVPPGDSTHEDDRWGARENPTPPAIECQ